jgi:hypothetical protein
MDTVFEFTIVYDADSAKAAVRVIVLRVWGVLVKATAVLTTLCVVAVVWLAREDGAAWFYWALIPLVVAHAGQAWMIWRQSQRLMKKFAGSARVTLSEDSFGFASANGSHVVPWRLFKAAQRDSRNLFLYVSKTAAIVIPTKGVPPAAVQFMIDRTSSNGSGKTESPP